MKYLAVAAIAAYQRYLSPLKGFSCDFCGDWADDARCCSWRYNTTPTELDDNYPGNSPRRARRKKSATPKKPKLNDNVDSASDSIKK